MAFGNLHFAHCFIAFFMGGYVNAYDTVTVKSMTKTDVFFRRPGATRLKVCVWGEQDLNEQRLASVAGETKGWLENHQGMEEFR